VGDGLHVDGMATGRLVRILSVVDASTRECLNVRWFRTLGDVRQKLADWQQEYNCERPHSSLDYRTRRSSNAPALFANINHQQQRKTPVMNE